MFSNIALIFGILIVLGIGVAESHRKYEKLNEELSEFLSKRKNEKSPKKTETKSLYRCKMQTNMRKSSETGELINDMTNFVMNFVEKQEESDISRREIVNSIQIDSRNCPFSSTNIVCNPRDYQSYDGSCNNLNNPFYGKSNTPYKRLISPSYGDGINSPRTLAISGRPLPHPRSVSLAVSLPLPPGQQRLERQITQLFASFGQFLTHDISGTSTITDTSGNELSCPCGTTDASCMTLTWPADDQFLRQSCMEFTRSSSSFADLSCSTSYREQLNLLSSFIDGTQIYGIDAERANQLRSFSGGMLKVSAGLPADNRGLTNRTYLPLHSDVCSSTGSRKCYLAGEFRTSENLGLVSMQTLFNREHNRIAKELARLKPNWDDNKIYFETRKIVIAEIQHVVYNEWLPLVSGRTELSPIPLNSANPYYTGYDKTVNPALANEFATAAFRMGHSLIRDRFTRLDALQQVYRNRNYLFDEVVFKSDHAYDSTTQGLNSILLGLTTDMSWKFGTFGTELQNNLFQNGELRNSPLFRAVDLLSTNINRGRDHGLKPYVHYVRMCHNIVVNNFNDLRPLMNGQRIQALQSIYESVQDIDLYAGGLSEDSLSDTEAVGRTFGCIIMNQFRDLKNGDRFYYENGPAVNPSAFTATQLQEIKKVTMSGLICNNYDLSVIQRNAFLDPMAPGNQPASCSVWRSYLDLNRWFI